MQALINDLGKEIIDQLDEEIVMDRIAKYYIDKKNINLLFDKVEASIIKNIPNKFEELFVRIYGNDKQYESVNNKFLTLRYNMPVILFNQKMEYLVIDQITLFQKLRIKIIESNRDNTFSNLHKGEYTIVDTLFDTITFYYELNNSYFKFQIAAIYMASTPSISSRSSKEEPNKIENNCSKNNITPIKPS